MKTPATLRRPFVRSSLASAFLGVALMGGALAVVSGTAGAISFPESAAVVRPEAVQAADSATFRRHSTTLANPFFEGRAPGTRGNLLAADYIEFHFKKFGLKPAFTEKGEGDQPGAPTYRQPFPFGSNISMKEAAITVNGPSPVKLEQGKDFTVLGFSGDAEATGPLVFVGYGINIGKDGYASYPGDADLKGKIAVVLRFEPMNEEGKSKWDDSGWSFHAGLEPKIQQAVKRGAAGVILVSAPGADDERTSKLETLDNTKPAGKAVDVPVVMMTIEEADKLVRAGDEQGRSLMDLRKIADDVETVVDKGSVIDLPKASVTVKAKVTHDPIITSNMGGVLAGAGNLADQYIVIGAHYDHVGYGYFSSRGGPDARGKVHPGADDNASGTSGMLMLAEKLTAAYAAMPADAPRRSILFMGFTAEESGLVGSHHYIKNMIVPKEQHAIMINLDMIGRYRGDDEKQPPLELGGVATAKGLEEFIKPMLDSSGLRIAPKPGGFGPSDHASFFAAGIPVLFFFTGLHEEYHAPGDTAETLNCDGAARIVELVDRIATACVTRPEAFEYNGDAESSPSAASGDPAADAPARPRSKVRFGITPGDYSGNDGVLVGEVAEGGTAAEAGILKGDRMIKWNGEALTSVESWMPFLTKHEPGDKVDIVVVRDGKEVTVQATLKGRKATNQ